MPDFDDLPYAESGGYAPNSFFITCYAASLITGVAYLLGYTNLYVCSVGPLTWVLPLALLGVLQLLHYVIRSATHEALRMSSADDALDALVLEQTQRAAARTLTPMTLAASLEDAS